MCVWVSACADEYEREARAWIEMNYNPIDNFFPSLTPNANLLLLHMHYIYYIILYYIILY